MGSGEFPLQADGFINEQRANNCQHDADKKHEHCQFETVPAHKRERPERKDKIKNMAHNVAGNGIDYGFHANEPASNFARLKFAEKSSRQSDKSPEKRGLNRKVNIRDKTSDGD